MIDARTNGLSSVLVRRLGDAPASVQRWTLDAPAHECTVDLASGTLYLQGWLLQQAPTELPPQVLVRAAGDVDGPVQRFAFNSGRPDVIERVLGQPGSNHAQLRCGFALRLALPDAALQLGFELDGAPAFWVLELSLRPTTKVIEGRDGWLFLDNDTNHSVDQFTGRLLLSAAQQQQWRQYLADCGALAARLGARFAMMLAPSKEEVLRHRYPYERAVTTVLDQVCALAAPEWPVLDAAPVLGAHVPPEACFKQTDTHWTDRGAMLATLAVLPYLGLDAAQAQALFVQDVYEQRNEVGDLGCKLLPVRSAPTEFLQGPAPEAGAIFDNRLPNIGRTLVFENAGALHPFKVLVFGASSGYPMLKYLKRIFSRVVFVHSAAQVDVGVVAYEKPDALLLQSNGRFLVQAPHMRFSLADAVRTKLSEASPALKNSIREWLATMPANPSEKLYREMLLSAYELQ